MNYLGLLSYNFLEPKLISDMVVTFHHVFFISLNLQLACLSGLKYYLSNTRHSRYMFKMKSYSAVLMSWIFEPYA